MGGGDRAHPDSQRTSQASMHEVRAYTYKKVNRQEEPLEAAISDTALHREPGSRELGKSRTLKLWLQPPIHRLPGRGPLGN